MGFYPLASVCGRRVKTIKIIKRKRIKIMETLTASQPKKLTKQEYNKLYYQRTRAHRLQRKDTQVLGASLSDNQNVTLSTGSFWSVKGLIRVLEIVTLLILTISMTGYMIHESASFYLEANDSLTLAYIKAAMIEILAILFSFSRSRSAFLQWGQRVVLVMLCGLTLSTMTGKVVKSASQDTMKTQSMLKMIQELESEKNQKEALRNEYLKKGWLSRTHQYERGIDQIREKLVAAHQMSASLHSREVIASGLGILLLFRLLTMLANFICVHRLAEFLIRDNALNAKA